MDKKNTPEQPERASILLPQSENKTVLFIIKKTEKLSAALYLLTEFFAPADPLARSIREHVLFLVSLSFSFLDSRAQAAGSEQVERELRIVRSLLSIAALSRLISEMNARILEQEIAIMLHYLDPARLGGNRLLSSSFFCDQPELLVAPDMVQEEMKKSSQAGAGIIKDIGTKDTVSYNTAYKQRLSSEKRQLSNTPSKTARRDEIVALFKRNKKSEMSIKDISAFIAGCSEKTIQRELLDLVQKGVLKKEGERRWSRYSLLTLEQK